MVSKWKKKNYLQELKDDISNLLNEYKLSNYKKQAFAWKLNASFTRTFDESYLWNRALFLATNSCFLLLNNTEKNTALKGLNESAEIYEYLSEIRQISEKYDKDYLLILSALCYDLSGYQANAYCVSNRIVDFELKSLDNDIPLTVDNAIIEQIRLILLKKIPYALSKLNDIEIKNNLGLSLFVKALNEWYQYILKLKEVDFRKAVDMYTHTIYILEILIYLIYYSC